MCQHCGCRQVISQGKEAVLQRVVEIVKELKLTAANVDDYESSETITDIIVPFASRQDEFYQVASWISGLHQGMPQSGRDERYQAHVRAFQDILARLPLQGDPKLIVTTYHQLEQLIRELDKTAINSLDPAVKGAVQAVEHVHEDTTRAGRLKERYGL